MQRIFLTDLASPHFSSPCLTGIRTKVVDVTKRDQVEALAMEHGHVDVLFNVAGYRPYLLLLYLVLIVID